MKIYNETKTQEITDYDPAKGRLVSDTIVIKQHAATPAVPAKTAAEIAEELAAQGKTVEAQFFKQKDGKEIPISAAAATRAMQLHAGDVQIHTKHYEVLKTYPNGGRDVREIKPTEAVPAKEAWDETEDIQVYIPYTEEELAAIEARKAIAEAKTYLNKTDYIVLKIAEAQAEGDTAGVAALQAEYAKQLAARKQARVTVNENEEKARLI